jgi:DNA-binding transcriptional ArsR family regulator
LAPADPRERLEEADRIFAALAHPSRRQILLTLRFRGGRMSAGDIAERFGCAWPTTSRHLKVLRDAGLVTVERRGREREYVLAAGRLRGTVGEWLGWFEDGGDGCRSIDVRKSSFSRGGGTPQG